MARLAMRQKGQKKRGPKVSYYRVETKLVKKWSEEEQKNEDDRSERKRGPRGGLSPSNISGDFKMSPTEICPNPKCFSYDELPELPVLFSVDHLRLHLSDFVRVLLFHTRYVPSPIHCSSGRCSIHHSLSSIFAFSIL